MNTYTPGIYDISNEDYHGANGLSRSALMLFKKSPMHYANVYEKERKVESTITPAFILGNAVHTYILEPLQFESRYLVAYKPDGRTKEGKEMMERINIEACGRTILASNVFAEVEKMGNSFLNNEIACQFLKDAQIEKSIFWKDCHTNTLLKCRPDIWLPNMIGDVKTTVDASPRAFQRDIAQYGYHIQAAMIQDGIYHITGKRITEYVTLAIEKTAPYAIGIYILDQEAIDRGRQEYNELMEQYNDYSERQVWPGYKPSTISLPAYY
jgi:hypothetical protein